MRRKNQFYSLLVGVMLFITACDKKSSDSNNVKAYKESNETEASSSLVIENIINETVTNVIKESHVDSKEKEEENYTFTFKNLENKSSILSVKNDLYSFSNIKQPLVMVVLASTWCPPCRSEIPHLSSLQKKFKKNLFILAGVVHDDISDKELRKLIISEKVNFYVSTNQKDNLNFTEMITEKLGITPKKFILPLMILFANGKYFTHYEGRMPEEMIESDIKQILEKINSNTK